MFHSFSIDEHATQVLDQEFWSSTFKEAIRIMGHTLMMLSPWHTPQPLARAWCLWELHCTVSVGADFSICLGPDEQASLEGALCENSSAVLDAFAHIDVATAEAGNPDDQAMILQAVRATPGGTEDLNARALAQMRKWVREVVATMVAARRVGDGSLDPQHLSAVNNLAIVLDRMRRREARPLLEEVMAAKTKKYGPGHASTLKTKHNLACVLKKMQEPAEARKLLEEVVAGQAEHLGAAHADTLGPKGDLAVLMKEMGEPAKARSLYEEVVAGFTQLHGPNHKSTLINKGNLAVLLEEVGEQDKARHLFEEVLAAETKLLGSGHTDTMMTKMNLAGLVAEMGDKLQARRLFEEVFAGQVQQLGATHPNTLGTKGNLATMLNDMGELAEARRMSGEVVAGLTEQLGADHPMTQHFAEQHASMAE